MARTDKQLSNLLCTQTSCEHSGTATRPSCTLLKVGGAGEAGALGECRVSHNSECLGWKEIFLVSHGEWAYTSEAQGSNYCLTLGT